MKAASKRFSFVLLAVMTVLLSAVLISIGVSAAECAGDSHALQYEVVDGTLKCICPCGAFNALAEKNAEGGPVVYLGTRFAEDGTTELASGNGLAADMAIKTPEELVNLFSVYKAGGAPKPITVVVVGRFVVESELTVDAGNKVIFTSTRGGVDYASKENGYARLYLNANVHCYNDMVFDQVIFEHPKTSRYIGLNGHNLTVTGVLYYSETAKTKMITSISSTALYGILTGDLLNEGFKGTNLANLNQTLNIDSGMWICIDVGCYRSVKTSAFLDMSGKVTVNLSGNAQIINRAKSDPVKYRGLSAASQIVSANGLDVVFNISGGKYVLNCGLNVIGRDSQAPKAARNINATYNITGGDFGECEVYSTVRTELTNSIPTAGKVVFNVTEGVNLGEHFIEAGKDAYNVIPKPQTPEEKPEEKPEEQPAEKPEETPEGTRKYENQFTDVTDDKWFAKYVKIAYEQGLANGMSATKFSPDSKFTVAQALTVAVNIHKAYNGTTVRAANAGEAWYTPYVEYCVGNNIVTADRFTDFDRNITRGEMAMVFASILPETEYEKVRDGVNPDVADDADYAAAVTKLYQAGIVSGDDKGNYRPNDEILRSEACVIFTRIAVPAERAK